jgi:copper oxidase (laccase) domain-containing protein
MNKNKKGNKNNEYYEIKKFEDFNSIVFNLKFNNYIEKSENRFFAIFTKKVLGNLSFSNKNFNKEETLKNIDKISAYFEFLNNKKIFGLKLQHLNNFFFIDEKIDNRDKNNFKLFDSINERFFFFKSEADAIGSNQDKIVSLITYADCIPIAFFDLKNRLFFSIHSGWKTTVLNIIENILFFLRKKFDSDHNFIKVIVGPSIFYENYNFNPESIKIFFDEILLKNCNILNNNLSEKNENYKEYFAKRLNFINENFIVYKNKNYFFNFRELLINDIKNCGVEIIDLIDRDTFSDNEFSSFRKDGNNFVAQGLFTGLF